MSFFTMVAYDTVISLLIGTLIILAIVSTRRLSNSWINRKIIHLSAAPAALCYMYVYHEPYTFFLFSLGLSAVLILLRISDAHLRWFQLEKNYGEVFFVLSFSLLSIALWNSYKLLAGMVMLFMSVGDSVTGFTRYLFIKERRKHWSGSVAMLITTSLIGFLIFGYVGVLIACAAALAEYQPYVDDNIAIPLVTTAMGLLLIR